MSADGRGDRHRQVAEQAAEWLLLLQSHELTASDREQFVHWLRESPRHIAEMLRICQLHGTLANFAEWGSVRAAESPCEDAVVELFGAPARNGPAHPARSGPAQLSAVRPGRGLRPLLVAAFAGAVIIGALMVAALRQTIISTQLGERREVALADGSVVDVAPNTELHVRFGRTERRVRLDRGDALFHVSKNPSRPFIVEAESARVWAVGTAFSVERSAAGIVVTVIEGKVAVVAETRPPVSTTIGRRAPPSPSVAVGANQQVIVRRNGDLAPIRNVNGEVETAWTAGQLIFEDESVANVVRRFNSYNHKQIRVLDDALASRRIRGVFRASDPDAFVLFLKSAAAVSAVRTDGDTILVGAAGIRDDALP